MDYLALINIWGIGFLGMLFLVVAALELAQVIKYYISKPSREELMANIENMKISKVIFRCIFWFYYIPRGIILSILNRKEMK